MSYEKNMPPISDQAKALRPGIYRHFKGDDFKVICAARHSEARDQEFVVYQSLKYPDRIWVRPLKMFLEDVDRPEYNYKGPRFSYLGPEKK